MNTKISIDSLGLSETEKAVLREVRDTLIQEYSERLQLLVLFGSKSRGDDSEFSDFDILVVVDDAEPWDLSEQMHDSVYPLMAKYDYRIVISLIVLNKEHYSRIKQIGTSFYQNLEKEGVSLWTAA